MVFSREQPWSENPNTPKIPYSAYLEEKATFAGTLISAILYGMLVVLFFQCIATLLDPVHRKSEGIKWGLVSYTMAMFSLATSGMLPPGPTGYLLSVWSDPLAITPTVVFLLNNWLADGLLVYRCYVIYSMSRQVIAFPCLVYLTSLAIGTMVIIGEAGGSPYIATHFTLPSLLISLSLNVLLTLMIIIRLVLHSRDIRAILGTPLGGTSGLYKTIITMLIESCAIFAVSSVLVIGLLVTGNHALSTFMPVLTGTQVIAPLLVIQRVTSKTALTSETNIIGSISLFRARDRGELTGSSNYVCERITDSGKLLVETVVNFHWGSEDRDLKV